VTIYNGRPAIIGTVLDVTERKNLEKQRTDFLAMITHDFKSPLTCILGFAELISKTKTDAGDKDTAEMAHSILESGEKLRSLVEDFLVQSKLDSKDIILELTPVEAYAILNEAKKEFAAQAAIKSLTVEIEAADNISKLYADRKLVQRALFNLFENAVNYTPAGGKVTLRAENRLEKDQTFVVVSVTDTGPGIPVYEQKRIFDKYYRLSRTSRIKGTGLGLAIVKGAAEAHGGRVEVESEVGKGSTFRLFIPVNLEKKETA
jgi:signal transduction histidine kinase